jgi:hypothetical protein
MFGIRVISGHREVSPETWTFSDRRLIPVIPEKTTCCTIAWQNLFRTPAIRVSSRAASETERGSTCKQLFSLNLNFQQSSYDRFLHDDSQVLKFVVVPLASSDTSVPPDRLTLPTFTPLGAASKRRRVSLNEAESTFPGFDGPITTLLGTLNGEGTPVPIQWGDPITENPALNTIEIWEMYNFTEDAYPIHIDEVQFQAVNRQPFGRRATRPPERWETGFKDTVIAYPDEITRVKALFDNPGLFVWHQVLSVHPHPTERSR